MKLKEGQTLKGHDLGACPFCAGRLSATDPKDKHMAVMHSLPTCEMFDNLDPIDFLRECNRKLRQS